MKQPIRIYTPEVELLTELDNYQSLQFTRDFFAVGEFELHINMYAHGVRELEKGNIILLDKQQNKAGIIRSKEIELDSSGKKSENYTITGYTLDGLISRRITVPPSDTAYDRKSGSVETVMKHYIRNHFTDPADENRKMPRLEIAPDLERGGHVDYESRFKNVAEELEIIGNIGNIGWNVSLDVVNRKFVFDVIEPGDLTQGNNDGNSPVFFSPDFGTIESQTFTDSDTDYKNTGYVGGPGEGIDRTVVEIGESTGWDRIETFVDARDIGGEGQDEEDLTDEEIKEQLESRGAEKMKDMERLLSFEAEILSPATEETSPFVYERDYDLGDTVDVINKNWGITMQAPVVIIKEIHEQNGFKLEATFGEEQPDFIKKIKREFDDLKGIERQEFPSRIQMEAIKYTDSEVTKEQLERINQARENLQKAIDKSEEVRADVRAELYGFASIFEDHYEDLQEQVNGRLDTHFDNHEPTLENEPAVNWDTTLLKESHVGDMFYNRDTGYAYTFVRDSYVHEGYVQPGQPTGYFNYAWQRIQDKDIIDALEEAANAKDTADGKRRTFVDTPYAPYDEGDMWVTEEDGGVIKFYTAQYSRDESEVFNIGDWELTSDITDENTSRDTNYVDGRPSREIEDRQGSQDKADESERRSKDYTEDYGDYIEREAKEYADRQITETENTIYDKVVAQEIFDSTVSDILSDLDDKASDLDVSELIDAANELRTEIAEHADELEEQGGRIVDVETDLNTIDGTLSATITELSDLDNIISRQELDIEANAKGLEAKADSTTVDSLEGTISDHSAELNFLNDEIVTKVEESFVRDAIGDIEVGGRNLLTGTSDKFQTYDVTASWGDWVAPGTNGRNFPVSPGETYTARIYFESDESNIKNVAIMVRTMIEPNGSHQDGRDFLGNWISPGDEGYSSVTFTVPEGMSHLHVYAIRFNNRENVRNIVRYKELKLERGTQETDWGLAPEDILSVQENHNTAINQNSREISAQANSIVELEDDIYSAQAEISVMSDAIDARVEETIFNEETGKLDNRLTDMEITADGLLVDISDVQANLNEAEQTLSNHSTQIDANAQDIALRARQTEVDNVKGAIDDMEAELQVQANEISATVKEGDIINSINLSGEAARIHASNIEFVGAVTVLSDITDSLGTIQAGTINGADINGSSFNQSGDNGSITLNDEGLTVQGNESSIHFDIDDDDPRSTSGSEVATLAFTATANFGFMEIYQDEASSVIRSDSSMSINADGVININGSSASIAGDLRVSGDIDSNNALNMNSTGYNNGLILGSKNTGLFHSVTQNNSDSSFYIYVQRYSGANRFTVRSHHRHSDYVNDLRISNQGTLYVPRTYNNTTTNSPTVRVGTSAGHFTSTVSTRAAKLSIEPVTKHVDPYKLLDVQASDWFDKGDAERLSDTLTQQMNGEYYELEDIERIKRIPGVVAEDVEEAGLTEFVDYDESGQLKSVLYDRLWTLLIPITKDHNEMLNDHDKSIEELKEENKRLKQRVETLEKGA
ncbi:Gp37-like protein [Oceanobacillus oncorhynchi]|uniref:Gp37-like protein n=1 Tax=Oceanobacillus oncorhynchi TaxID=545501 RepID=UPI0034D6B74C